jgi:hypothetical protein
MVSGTAFAQQGGGMMGGGGGGGGPGACPPGQECPQLKHSHRNGPGANGGTQLQGPGGNMQMQGEGNGPQGKKRMQTQGNMNGGQQNGPSGQQQFLPKHNQGQAQNPPRHNEGQASNGNHMNKKDAFRRMHVSPAPHITFNVRVGAPIPHAHRPHLYPLPPYFLTFYPSYRHYEYFMTPDGYIVVVNPRTWRIVAVIPA